MTKSENQTIGSGGNSKTSFCLIYYEEYIFANLKRTDSTLTGYAKGIYHFQLATANADNANGDILQWDHTSFYLNIDEAGVGQVTLSPPRSRTHVPERDGTHQYRVYPADTASVSDENRRRRSV